MKYTENIFQNDLWNCILVKSKKKKLNKNHINFVKFLFLTSTLFFFFILMYWPIFPFIHLCWLYIYSYAVSSTVHKHIFTYMCRVMVSNSPFFSIHPCELFFFSFILKQIVYSILTECFDFGLKNLWRANLSGTFRM